MSNGYKITRSNYTLKRRHQTLSGGVVFERDFMTTTNLGPWDSGSIPYGENNFKMYYRATSNAKKHPYKGEWLKNDCSGETWTSGCVQDAVVGSAKIRIKPNYNSLLDFAYYGSCVELVKSTITKIIKEFPAEMFVISGNEYGFNGESLLRNSFEINLTDTIVPEGENELRYFLNSYEQYYVKINNAVRTISNVTVVEKKDSCGNFIIKLTISGYGDANICGVTYESGVNVVKTNLPAGTRITPRSERVDDFFEGIDDFTCVLLNRNTTPIYSVILDTPRETDRGVETYRVTYTWPTENGWNLQIYGEKFQIYIDGILSIAEFYDEYYTNNLWRMLTHDSIKAMDLAFSNPEKDEDKEDYNIGTTRLEGLFWAIGRQFDEIKRAIDNIKNTPRITYDGNNNVPDYFITDALNLGGWETRNIDIELSKEDKTGQLFAGVPNGYDSSDANNIFLRNLKLNSKSIFSKKGTRQGIESLLSVFGLISTDMWNMLPQDERPAYADYTINEYVSVVSNSSNATVSGYTTDLPLLKIEEYNTLKLSYDDSEMSEEGSMYDTTQGIPCEVKYIEENGKIWKYIVPWFDKSKNYDGGLYYQSRGGWGFNGSTQRALDLAVSSGIGYTETVKYLIIVDKISDLRNIPIKKLYNGTIAYVTNLDYDPDAPISITEYSSNYFVLNHVQYYYNIGGDGDGWVNLSKAYAESDIKISYINSIVEDYLGNNPHVGFGRYDLGREYLEYIKTPLKYSVDKDVLEQEKMFDESAYDCDGRLKYYGTVFELNEDIIDNMKCWYFGPLSENGNVYKLVKNSNGKYAHSGGRYSPTVGNSSWATFNSNISAFDFISKRTVNSANEVTCDSIVNTKYLQIVFNVKPSEKEDFEKFFKSAILPYLIQLIPSDVILKQEVELQAENSATIYDTTPNGTAESINAIAGVAQGNDDYIVNFPTDNSIENYLFPLSGV